MPYNSRLLTWFFTPQQLNFFLQSFKAWNTIDEVQLKERIWNVYFELIWHEENVQILDETLLADYKAQRTRMRDKYQQLTGPSGCDTMDMYTELFREQAVLAHFELNKFTLSA